MAQFELTDVDEARIRWREIAEEKYLWELERESRERAMRSTAPVIKLTAIAAGLVLIGLLLEVFA